MKLGDRTHIAPRIYIDTVTPWLITIEDYVTIAPYVSIITHDASLAHYTSQTRLGRVDILKRAYIGVGAVLLPGTTIGEDSVVGAGAVVNGTIPPRSLVVGNPGKATPIKGALAWHQATARRAPSWPAEGWTIHTGITEENKRTQREALADGASGYVPASAAPESPFQEAQE